MLIPVEASTQQLLLIRLRQPDLRLEMINNKASKEEVKETKE